MYQEEWDEAIASVTDSSECPQNNGLRLKEQLGLVPIGRDPEPGLWEFWQVQIGERPQRDENGKLLLPGDMGLVFVLIPGGMFWMGAQATDPEGRNYDPDAKDDESDNGSPVEVTLDAYLLSKYEMTQGHWRRFTGTNPAAYGPGFNTARQTVVRRPGSASRTSVMASLFTLPWVDAGKMRLACTMRSEMSLSGAWIVTAATPAPPGRAVGDGELQALRIPWAAEAVSTN